MSDHPRVAATTNSDGASLHPSPSKPNNVQPNNSCISLDNTLRIIKYVYVYIEHKTRAQTRPTLDEGLSSSKWRATVRVQHPIINTRDARAGYTVIRAGGAHKTDLITANDKMPITLTSTHHVTDACPHLGRPPWRVATT